MREGDGKTLEGAARVKRDGAGTRTGHLLLGLLTLAVAFWGIGPAGLTPALAEEEKNAAADPAAEGVPILFPRTIRRTSGRTLPIPPEAVSADGRFGVGKVKPGEYGVVEISSGRILFRLTATGSRPRFALASDGSAMAVCRFTRLSVLDLPKGRPRFRIETGDTNREGVAVISFSSDGRRVATSAAKTRIFDAASGDLLHTLPVSALGLGFALEDRLLVTARSTTVQGWDAETGRELFRHQEEYNSFCGNRRSYHPFRISPDGRTFLSIGETGTPRHFEASTGREIFATRLGTGGAVHGEFLAGGNEIAAVGHDDRLHLFDAWTGRTRGAPAPLPKGQGTALPIATGRTGNLVIADREVLEEVPCVLRGHSSRVSALEFSADGARLLSGGWDRRVNAWIVAMPDRRASLEGAVGWIHDLDFSPTGGLVAACDEAGSVLVWRFQPWGLASTSPIVAVPGVGPCRGLDFAPDGKLLATAGADGKVRLWTIPLDLSDNGRYYGQAIEAVEAATIDAHSDEATHVVISSEGSHLASAGWDRRVRIFRLSEAGTPTPEASQGETFSLGETPVALTFVGSGEGLELLALDTGGNLHRWNLADSGEDPVSPSSLTPLGTRVAVASFAADGSRVAVAAGDSEIVLIDAHTGKRQALLRGHEAPVRSLVFSPDGRSLASGGSDERILLWDLLPSGTGDDASHRTSTPGKRASLWQALASVDTSAAYAAMDQLRRAGNDGVSWMRGWLLPESLPDADSIRRLIRDLAAEEYETRVAAHDALQSLGRLVETELTDALEQVESPEARWSLGRLLSDIEGNRTILDGQPLREVRALQTLERTASRAAVRLLEDLAALKDRPALAAGATSSLTRLKARGLR